MKKHQQIFLCTTLLVSLAACQAPVGFVNPPPTTTFTNHENSKTLAGKWRPAEEKNKEALEFIAQGNGKYGIKFPPMKSGEPDKEMAMLEQTLILQTAKFANQDWLLVSMSPEGIKLFAKELKNNDTSKNIPPNYLFQYVVKDQNTICFGNLNQKIFELAIKNKELEARGNHDKTKKNTNGNLRGVKHETREVVITSPAKQWIKWFETKDAKDYIEDKPLCLVRALDTAENKTLPETNPESKSQNDDANKIDSPKAP